MSVKPFKEITTKNEKLDRVQTNVTTFSDSVVSIEFLNGRLIEDVVLGTTEVQVEHKLGRELRGWIIVDKNAQQDVWKSASTLTKRFLSLTAAGTVTVSLWVF
jgi:hypothetical protein